MWGSGEDRWCITSQITSQSLELRPRTASKGTDQRNSVSWARVTVGKGRKTEEETVGCQSKGMTPSFPSKVMPSGEETPGNPETSLLCIQLLPKTYVAEEAQSFHVMIQPMLAEHTVCARY